MTFNGLTLNKGHTIDIGTLAENNDSDFILQYDLRRESVNAKSIKSKSIKSNKSLDTSFKGKSKREKIRKFFYKLARRDKPEELEALAGTEEREKERTARIMSTIRTAQLLRTNTYYSSLYPMTPSFKIKEDTEEEFRRARILSMRLHTNDFIESPTPIPSPIEVRRSPPMRRTSAIITRTAISSLISISRSLNVDQDATIHHSLLRQPNSLFEQLEELETDSESETSSIDSEESYYSFEKSEISRMITRRRTIIRRPVSNSLPSPINIDFWVQ